MSNLSGDGSWRMSTYNQKLTDKILNSGIPFPNIFHKIPADISNYLDHFGLPYNDVKYEGGYIKIGVNNIFVQSFTPPEYRKTAFLFHGYFDHSGYFSNIVTFFIKQGIRVVVWDQPGFGLSTGKRAFCNSFEEYAIVAEFILNKFKDIEEPEQHFFIGHSAGCTQILTLIRDRKIAQQDKIIFIAPLVHCVNWKGVVISLALFSSILKKVPRKLKKVSNEKDFVNKIRNDHLEDKVVDVSWPKAMVKWEQSLVELKTPIFHTLVLQGDLDDTVDWRYNLNWLENKFSNLEKLIIKGGRHHLHNDSPEIVKLCLKTIEDFIK